MIFTFSLHRFFTGSKLQDTFCDSAHSYEILVRLVLHLKWIVSCTVENLICSVYWAWIFRLVHTVWVWVCQY